MPKEYYTYYLDEALHKHEELQLEKTLTELTRHRILEILNNVIPLSGRLELIDFLQRIWVLESIQPTFSFDWSSFAEETRENMYKTAGWDNSYLLERIGFLSCSQYRIFEFLENLTSPIVREVNLQKQIIDKLNPILTNDGYVLKQNGFISGEPKYKVTLLNEGVAGSPKNLIFASTGLKPDIVLSDAINNDIKIVRNSEYCLVYDEELFPTGLKWKEMIAWWRKKHPKISDDIDVERELYKRLTASLKDSEPEQIFFRTYFKLFRSALGDMLPALIPQVYLHYDPLSIKELARTGQGNRLPRQRMDFLLLLNNNQRIVIEIDGKHHYADGDKASPSKYAEMVIADRNLRLLGYEVYRFGGQEFYQENIESDIQVFFDKLFRKYHLIN